MVHTSNPWNSKKFKIWIGIVVCLVVAVAAVGLTLRYTLFNDPLVDPDPVDPLPPSLSELGYYSKAAVVSDTHHCSEIGKNILLRNGTAADAAIAMLFCISVEVPQSAGIGGGFMMVHYSASTRQTTFLDARETAPAYAHRDMYGKNYTLGLIGGQSIAVPGEIKGYMELYKKHGGKVPWKELVQPSIDLCRKGVPVTAHMAAALKDREKYIYLDSSMSDYLDPATGRIKKENDTLFRPTLVKTLEKLAVNPEDFYTGEIANALVEDIKAAGGNVTHHDMANYTALWKPPVEVTLPNGFKLYSIPPPGSGAVLALIMNMFTKAYQPHTDFPKLSKNQYDVLWHHRLIEAFKYAYALRHELGDPDFENIQPIVEKLLSMTYAEAMRAKIDDNKTSQDPKYYNAKMAATSEDHGTSHINVLAPNGDAVSATSTVNYYFGAVFTSPQTGILLNDEMGDFTAPGMKNVWGVPPSPINFIKPGKRPMSSMAPTILVDQKGKPRMIIGAAGGIRITTAIAYDVIRHLWLNETIKEVIDQCRVHHQTFPMEVSYQFGVLDHIIRGLRSKGHKVKRGEGFGSIVNGIAVDENGVVTANADFRKKGVVMGFEQFVPHHQNSRPTGNGR